MVLIAVAQVATAGVAKTDHRLSTLVTGRERPSLGTAGSQSTAKRLADVASEADLTGDLTNSGGVTEDGDVAAQPEFNDDAIVIPPVADGSSYAPPVPHGDLGLTAAGETAVFPKDRESVRLLGRSRELIAEGRYAEATQSLGRLMHLDDDFFFQPDESLPTHQSVRSEAARLLDQLPERGRQFYELQFGAEARNELEQALEAGDIEAIAETARRYFHTDAGFEASYLVALDHIDHGRPLLASLILRRMQESPRRAQSWEPMLSVRLAASWARGGELERARQIWRDMRRQYGDVDVRVGGRTLGTNAAALPGDAPHENDSDAYSWLAEVAEWAQHPAVESAEGWLVYRGTPSRNVQTDGGAVLLRSRWRVRTNTDPVLDDMLTQQQHAYHDVGLAPLPAAHPLVVGNVVLTRTLTNLTAVDFETGKRLWESASSTDASQIDELTPGADAPMAATLRQGLEQRVWNDITYGTLASDGNLVFAVEDISLGAASRRALGGGLNRNLWRFWDANPSNRLAAYDVHTGKLTWEVGGDRSDGLAMSDTFFLGPPLPLADKLYVLAERESEIRLWVLDAATGRPDWSQLLVVVEPDRNLSVARRMVGLSPSYADGVLVCPTASGAVVAVDLTTRGLLWGYQYAPSQNQGGIAWQLPFSRVAQPGGRGQFCRWIDGSVTLSDQCVLVAAVESDELHCLELHSGSARWTVSPDDAAFVAGVADEKVFVVGQRGAQAYRLSDGSAVWDDDGLVFPEEVMPTGRGFLHAGQYFLPTRHGGLASIDLARGELTFDATSTESPELGNLVVHAGSVISATAHGVDRFLQVDAARQALEQRVAASSNDPDRFALEAELHLHSGRLEAAVATLERGRQVGGGARIDGLLLESLLRGMQTDFQRYRDRCDEIERLLRHPADRAVYYRLLAEGRRATVTFLGPWTPI
ncbi:MAG: PQQ-binding-like beta-propeller repeat protein [Pirellulales bacterium]